MKGLKNDYVFYSLLDNDDKLFESFKKKLEDMKFDFSKLKKIEPIELLQIDLSSEELFMINFVMHK